MSSWHDVFSGLQNNVTAALAGVVDANSITLGFPPAAVTMNAGQVNTLGTASANPLTPLVMLYDRGFSHNATRWVPRYITDWNIVAPGVTLSVPMLNIGVNGLGSATVLTGAYANDAVGLWVSGNNTAGGTVVFNAAASATSVASQIAAQISSVFVGKLSATNSGAIVTVVNLGAAPVTVNLNTANVGSALYEVKRVRRSTQIIALANNPDALDLIGEPISQMLGKMETSFGYVLPDGSYVRVVNPADACFWDNALNNIIRRDWIVDLEYGVTIVDEGFPMLVALLNWAP